MTARNRFSDWGNVPATVEGVVVNTNDPQQDGRVQVWCPGLDGDDIDFESLVWAKVASPFAGQVKNYPAGSDGMITEGYMAYGMWAMPKKDSVVIVTLLNNDPNQRRVIGSVFGVHGNRSIPTGRNRPDLGHSAPVSDTFDPVQPQTNNLKIQFQGKLNAPEARTRGAYERQAGQDKDVRDGTEGYQNTPFANEQYLDAQTYAITTPGRHAIIMQDNPATGRMRFKTADGNQIILDDANERIYVSTCHGKSWLEMDKNGKVFIYAADDLAIASGGNIDLVAGGKLTLSGKGGVNVVSGGDLLMSACGNAALSGQTTFLESGGTLNILAAGNLMQTGANIHLNGQAAASAPCPSGPINVPNHEPWTRPASKTSRGKFWKA